MAHRVVSCVWQKRISSDLGGLCWVFNPGPVVQEMAGCETMPTRAFFQSLGSPEHCPPPGLLKLVLQDKTDRRTQQRPYYISTCANLQTTLMLQNHESSHCAGG